MILTLQTRAVIRTLDTCTKLKKNGLIYHEVLCSSEVTTPTAGNCYSRKQWAEPHRELRYFAPYPCHKELKSFSKNSAVAEQ